jgi:hypothetical protein
LSSLIDIAVSTTIPTPPSSTGVTHAIRSRTRRESLRSSSGIAKRYAPASPGKITVPMISHSPGTYLSIWKRKRKYHSGRGG